MLFNLGINRTNKLKICKKKCRVIKLLICKYTIATDLINRPSLGCHGKTYLIKRSKKLKCIKKKRVYRRWVGYKN